MKKLVMMLMAVAVAFCAKAVAVDWKYNTVAEEEGYTMYLFTSEVAAEYATFGDLTEGAIGSAVVSAKTVKGKTTYSTGQIMTSADSIGDMLYAVVVSGPDAKTYTYGSFSTKNGDSSLVYDPSKQETSPGFATVTTFASAGTIVGGGGDVPEPTSGLLLLVGGAALALRRKQK